MSRAGDNLMDTLHLITAETLADIIRRGVPVVKDGEAVLDADGEPLRAPAPAAYIAAAIKFLKDNGVTAEPDSDRIKNARQALGDLPSFSEDEADDIPIYN